MSRQYITLRRVNWFLFVIEARFAYRELGTEVLEAI
jgi:hypothetical protein